MLSPVLLIISVLEGRLAGQGYVDENKKASDMYGTCLCRNLQRTRQSEWGRGIIEI